MSVNLRQVQFGDQSVFATGVTPTLLYPGVMPDSIANFTTAGMEIQRTEADGNISGSSDIDTVFYEVGTNGDPSFNFTPTYEYIPYILDGLVEATPSGAGPYVYAYAEPTTAEVTPRLQSITVSPDGSNGARQLVGAITKSLSFSWTNTTKVESSVSFMGYDFAADSLETLSLPASFTPMWGSQCLVTIDAVGGTAGATPVTTVYSGNFSITPNFNYLPNAGTTHHAGVDGPNEWTVTGSLSMKLDATTAAYMSTTAAVKKLLRLKFTNGLLTTSLRQMQVDMTAWCKALNPFNNNNGTVLLDMEFQAVGGTLAIAVTNNTATLYA